MYILLMIDQYTIAVLLKTLNLLFSGNGKTFNFLND